MTDREHAGVSDDGTPSADHLHETWMERTSMAWTRTAMSWAGTGAVLARFLAEDGVDFRMVPAGAMVVCGFVMWIFGRYHYRARSTSLAAGAPEHRVGVGLAWVTAAVVVTVGTLVVAEIIAVAR